MIEGLFVIWDIWYFGSSGCRKYQAWYFGAPKYQAWYLNIKLDIRISSLIFWSFQISSLIFEYQARYSNIELDILELSNIKLDIRISSLIFGRDFPVLRYFELRLGGPPPFDILRPKISKNTDPKIWNSLFFFLSELWCPLLFFDILDLKNIKISKNIDFFDILIFWYFDSSGRSSGDWAGLLN